MSNNGKNNGNGEGEGEGWGSSFFKFAAAAAATATVAAGVLSVLSSASASESPEVPFHAGRVRNDQFDDTDDDDDDERGFNHHQNDVVLTPSVRWRFPLDDGWVKCNVDASGPRKIGASAGCAVVFRGASGNWLYGFSKSLDVEFWNSSSAELAAIHFGLEKARERVGHHKLILECDFLPGVDVVNNKEGACARTAAERELVQKIRSLENHISYVNVTHIPHKENLVAHRLAREARSFPLGTVRSLTGSTLESSYSSFNNSQYAQY